MLNLWAFLGGDTTFSQICNPGLLWYKNALKGKNTNTNTNYLRFFLTTTSIIVNKFIAVFVRLCHFVPFFQWQVQLVLPSTGCSAVNSERPDIHLSPNYCWPEQNYCSSAQPIKTRGWVYTESRYKSLYSCFMTATTFRRLNYLISSLFEYLRI